MCEGLPSQCHRPAVLSRTSFIPGFCRARRAPGRAAALPSAGSCPRPTPFPRCSGRRPSTPASGRGWAATWAGSRRSAGSRSTATPTRGAGPSTSRARSGSRSGTTSACDRRREPGPALADARMPGARWFPGAAINYAEHALSMPGRAPDDVVVIGRSQTRDDLDLTAAELRDAVARCRAGLQRLGVGRGDRVAAFLPNVPEAIIGAPGHGVARRRLVVLRAGVRDEGRRRPVRPDRADGPAHRSTATGTATGTSTGRRRSPRSARRCRPLRATVVVPYLRPEADAAIAVPGAEPWSRARSPTPAPLAFDPVPFDHPLYVLFSSGTTGPARSRSSTATAASSSSISRRSRSTRTSGPTTASAGSRRPAG